MNIDIVTEHVSMRPEWHDMIGDWLDQCRRRHPDVDGVDFILRHEDYEPAGDTVDLVARARGRRLRTATRAADMGIALYDALQALDHEIALNEAIRHPRPVQ